VVVVADERELMIAGKHVDHVRDDGATFHLDHGFGKVISRLAEPFSGS
jgi:hypothetical protein